MTARDSTQQTTAARGQNTGVPLSVLGFKSCRPYIDIYPHVSL